MSYTAWSVVFGEQPTAAKWNQLGANDAGFKDGTNIDNLAILTRHIADLNVTPAKLSAAANKYEELARTTLGSNAASISVASIPARKYLKIVTYTKGVAGSATGELLRFNNDSGNNYDHNRSIADGANSLTQNTSSIDAYGDVASQSYGEYDVINEAASNKPVYGRRMVAYPNGSTGVTWVDIAGVWRNSSALISRVDYLSTGALFATGSVVIVLGHD